jgi:hypothetical protein
MFPLSLVLAHIQLAKDINFEIRLFLFPPRLLQELSPLSRSQARHIFYKEKQEGSATNN